MAAQPKFLTVGFLRRAMLGKSDDTVVVTADFTGSGVAAGLDEIVRPVVLADGSAALAMTFHEPSAMGIKFKFDNSVN